jgi:hypothetical protein
MSIINGYPYGQAAKEAEIDREDEAETQGVDQPSAWRVGTVQPWKRFGYQTMGIRPVRLHSQLWTSQC